MNSPLRNCDCGDGDEELTQSFGYWAVYCHNCGIMGKRFANTTRINGAWPSDAARNAWNARVFEPEEV